MSDDSEQQDAAVVGVVELVAFGLVEVLVERVFAVRVCDEQVVRGQALLVARSEVRIVAVVQRLDEADRVLLRRKGEVALVLLVRTKCWFVFNLRKSSIFSIRVI